MADVEAPMGRTSRSYREPKESTQGPVANWRYALKGELNNSKMSEAMKESIMDAQKLAVPRDSNRYECYYTGVAVKNPHEPAPMAEHPMRPSFDAMYQVTMVEDEEDHTRKAIIHHPSNVVLVLVR